MYASLARFGYNIAKKIRPSKVKKFLKPAVDKATKPALKGTKMGAGEAKLISGVQGAAKKGFKGYKKIYGATLGTSGARKATSAGIGGYAIGSFLDSDD